MGKLSLVFNLMSVRVSARAAIGRIIMAMALALTSGARGQTGKVPSANVNTNTASPTNVTAALQPGATLAVTNYLGQPLITTSGTGPITALISGPDGALWGVNVDYPSPFYRVSTNGSSEVIYNGYFDGEDTVPGSPLVLTTGPDGAIWFTSTTCYTGSGTVFACIGRMLTSGFVTSHFTIPGATPGLSPNPFTIVTGSDGNLWIVAGQSIWSLSPAGVFTSYTVPPDSDINGLTAGPDGNIWFTYSTGATQGVGSIAPTGKTSTYIVPVTTSSAGSCGYAPNSITAGTDGTLWFLAGGCAISISTDGSKINRYPFPAGVSVGENLVQGPDGANWTYSAGKGYLRLSTSGIYTWIPVPVSLSSLVFGGASLTVGPDGAFWTSVVDNSGNLLIQRAVLGLGSTGGTLLPLASVGTPYNPGVSGLTLYNSGGGPYALYGSTTLPAGLTLNNTTGQITGTPTGPSATSTFSMLDLSDPTNPGYSNFAMNVTASPVTPLSISTSTLPNYTVGTSYSASFVAQGGTAPYKWIAGGSGRFFPPGIELSGYELNGTNNSPPLSGTPTTSGTYTFVVEVTDSGTPTQTAYKTFTLTGSIAPLAITTTTLANGTVGTAYSASPTAQGGTAPYGNWAVSKGSLPPGLQPINPLTGTITGTPTMAGTYNFTVTLTDSGNPAQTASQPLSITILPATLTITTAALLGGTVGTSYSASLIAQGGTTPYSNWSLSAGSLPTGLTLNGSTGAITGTPTNAGTFNFTAKLIDSGNPSQIATQALSITIAPATLIITPISLPSGTVGTAYSIGLTAQGGTTPYSNWTLSAGSLPTGLTLNATTGAITGTPTNAGTFNFTVKLIDSGNPPQTATQALSITIAPATLIITPISLPSGTVGTAYSIGLTAQGGTTPYSNWSVSSGSLPAGLTMNATTGAITGTPTNAGKSNFTAKLIDSGNPAQTASQTFSITIAPAALIITPISMPNGTVGTAYSAALTAQGGTTPYSNWSVSSGSLPTGLTLDATTGAIAGTLTTAGTFNFTVKLTDSGNPAQTASQTFSITIAPAALLITTASLPNGTVGTAYSTALAAQGGTTPYSNWSLNSGSLPAGLTLNSSTGGISGTSTSAGTYPFSVKLTDSGSPAQSATKSLSITIAPATLVITSTTLSNGTVGIAYSASITAQGGTTPYSNWSVTSGLLPAGLTLNPSTGAITGTPTAAGLSTFTVKLTDSGSPTQTTTQIMSITIAPAGLTITTTTLPAGTVGTTYLANVGAQGGTTPYGNWTLSAGSLPAGLSLSSTTGAITGTPTAAGTSTFTVKLIDSGSPAQTATQVLSLTVNPAALTISTAALPNGTVGAAYNTPLTAQGGTAPFTNWTLTAGALPGGLTLNATTGAISGTPNAAGNFAFTIKTLDSGTPAQSATKSLNITIAPAGLAITTTTLIGGTVGANYSANLSAQGGTTPYSNWTLASGALPGGLVLNASSGSLTGTPTAAGNFTFSIKLVDSGSPAQIAVQSITVNISPETLAITTTSIASGTAGLPYSSSVDAQGGTTPYTWAVSSGTLPGGLTLNSSSGAITGTPNSSGSFTFTVKVTDSGSPAQTATQSFSLSISSGLAITTTALANGTVGLAYSATLGVQNGTAPYTWTLTKGSLPPGPLSLNPHTGVITGAPGIAGTYTFSVAVTDSTAPTAQTATQALTLVINNPPVTAPAAPTGTISGLPATATPGQTIPGVTAQLNQASAVDYTSTLTLSLTPSPSVANPLPAGNTGDAGFMAGSGKSVTDNLTVQAASTAVTLPNLDPGTVAGNITMTLSAGGQTVAASSTSVPATAPIITSTPTFTNETSNGFDVEVIATSTTRELTTATFTFNPAPGAQLSGDTKVTVPVTQALTNWFSSPNSQQYGGRFLLTVSFTLTGSISAIQSVTVELGNTVGTSSPSTPATP